MPLLVAIIVWVIHILIIGSLAAPQEKKPGSRQTGKSEKLPAQNVRFPINARSITQS
jgi:hypothetical protein